MGNLQPDRVMAAQPFSGVGTDFAGPFAFKLSHLRNAKSLKVNLRVFMCVTTKVVHLDIIGARSTEACITSWATWHRHLTS